MTTMAELAGYAAARYGSQPAQRSKLGGERADGSYEEMNADARSIALGLIELGIAPGDRVCILAATNAEWTRAELGAWMAGAVVVPIYPTNSPEECEWVAGNSGAVALFAHDASQLAKIAAVRAQLPELEHLIVFEGSDEAAITLEDLRQRGASVDEAELERRIAGVSADDAMLFIYTSGTTGPPKGCVLTHGNGRALLDMLVELQITVGSDVVYLYLPLAHVFAQLIEVGALYLGGTLAYCSGDTKMIVPEIQETQPDYVPSVPRIFEKIYGLATAQLNDASDEQREQFRQAVALGVRVRDLEHRGEPVPEELRAPFEQADEAIFSKVRALFGGRMREATTGAAPIAKEILEFFYAAGCPVLEGYGMTETMGVMTVSTREDHKFGTVGRPMPGVEVKIADDGEIMCRGGNVFKGYWRNEEATREVLEPDGWLHTGDLGKLDEDGYLHITGRKKDIIITAGGKNLAPANLENDLKQSPWISQAIMYGDRRPYPVAIVTLDAEEIVPWAREQGLPEDVAELATEPKVEALIGEVLDRVNAKYAQVEQIKKIKILGHDLSLETGELTPTLKVKRNVVYERYSDDFDELYAK